MSDLQTIYLLKTKDTPLTTIYGFYNTHVSKM